MTFTSLRLTEAHTIPLLEGHARRLGPGSREALLDFAARETPGNYRVEWVAQSLTVRLRGRSLLVDQQAVRFVVSPFVDQRGPFAKPRPPSPYDEVRVSGVATLLTDRAGEVLYESCSAAVLAWDGRGLVLPPDDVPRVASVAEAEVVARMPYRRAPVCVEGDWPLLLINAVVGTCAIAVPGRAAFPAEVRAQLDALLT